MARLRTNFVRGTITNNPLAIGDTTLTSPSLSSLPVVSSPDILVLILDPAGAAPEIVHVTAHSSSATSATILRGQESSSAKAHIQGTAFVAGPTATDFPANAFPAAVANGDILYGVAASDEYQALAMTNLGVLVGGTTAPAWNAPTTPKTYLRLNAAGTALEWVEVPTIISADAFQWGTKVANRYSAIFTSELILSNAVFGDLADVGWAVNGNPAAPQPAGTGSTGDLDAANDAGQQFVRLAASGDGLASPKVIGGKSIIDSIEFHTGVRPATCTVRVQAAAEGTTDNADTSGVGISYRAGTILATGGAGSQFMVTLGATNFELWDGAAATDLGVAKDTAVHNFDIEIDIAAATYRVLIDGTERKASAALTQDFWPMCVKGFQGATGSVWNLFSYGVKYE